MDPKVQDQLLLDHLGIQDQPEEELGGDLSQQEVLLTCHAQLHLKHEQKFVKFDGI